MAMQIECVKLSSPLTLAMMNLHVAITPISDKVLLMASSASLKSKVVHDGLLVPVATYIDINIPNCKNHPKFTFSSLSMHYTIFSFFNFQYEVLPTHAYTIGLTSCTLLGAAIYVILQLNKSV